MSDDDDFDDEIFHNVVDISNAGKRRGGGPAKGNRPKNPKRTTELMPVLPDLNVDLDTLKRQATNPSKRARAAFHMKKLSIPLDEIAEFLDYETPGQCFSAICGVVASEAHRLDPKRLEVLQATIVAGLEDQLRRSITLASADGFRDETGVIHPNHARLAWHQEVRKDYEVLARISGAQAAMQVQLINPEAAELDRVIREIEHLQGRGIVEADVLEIEEIRDAQ